MDQQACNYSGFPVNHTPSELPTPDAAEVSRQPKRSGQLDVSSSRERTQSTNDTSKSISRETLAQITLQISECFIDNTVEDQEKEAEKIEINKVFHSTCLVDNPFSTNPHHAADVATKDNDFNYGIEEYNGSVPAAEDLLIPELRPQKSSKPFIITRDVIPSKSKGRRNNKKCLKNWEKDMHRDLEKNSKQNSTIVKSKNNSSSYGFRDYLRSPSDRDFPQVFDSSPNQMLSSPWTHPEFSEILDALRMENLDLADKKMNEPAAMIGLPSALLLVPGLDKEATQKKSKVNQRKKLKTSNATKSSQTLSSVKSSPFHHSTEEGSENESDDEYLELQNERDSKRNPNSICNNSLIVQNRVDLELTPQSQPRQASASQLPVEEPDVSRIAFGKSKIRTSFFTVIVNLMFTLLKDRTLGKGFRCAIMQEKFFRSLVQRRKWFQRVFEDYQNSEAILQRVGLYQEALQIVEYYEERQTEDQEACATVISYEEALQTVGQCQGYMESQGYRVAQQWNDFLKILWSKEWTQENQKSLPQDECIECSPGCKCAGCYEFGNLCALLHAIYKKGMDQQGQEKGEVRSLEKLSEIVGNGRFSEEDHVIEMNIKEFCEKASSSIMALFLKEEERFFETAIEQLYDPGRNSKKQPDEEKVLNKDQKKMLYLRYKGEIRSRFATPKAFLRKSATYEKR